MYTHYFGLFIVGAHSALILATAGFRWLQQRCGHPALTRTPDVTPGLLSILGVLVLYLPWIPVFLMQQAQVSEKYWISPPDLRTVPSYQLLSFYPSLQNTIITDLPLAIVALCFILLSIAAVRTKSWSASALLLLYWAPIVAAGAYSVFVSPILVPRYLIFSQVGFWGCIALTFCSLPGHARTACGLLVLTNLLTGHYLLNQQHDNSSRLGTRAVADHIREFSRPDDFVVVLARSEFPAIKFYLSERLTTRLVPTGQPRYHFHGWPIYTDMDTRYSELLSSPWTSRLWLVKTRDQQLEPGSAIDRNGWKPISSQSVTQIQNTPEGPTPVEALLYIRSPESMRQRSRKNEITVDYRRVEALTEAIQRIASQDATPWAVLHAILTLRVNTNSDDSLAKSAAQQQCLDYLLGSDVPSRVFTLRNGRPFPRRRSEQRTGEGHFGQALYAMAVAGISGNVVLNIDGEQFHVDELVDTILREFSSEKESEWLAAALPSYIESERSWVNKYNEIQSLPIILEHLLTKEPSDACYRTHHMIAINRLLAARVGFDGTRPQRAHFQKALEAASNWTAVALSQQRGDGALLPPDDSGVESGHDTELAALLFTGHVVEAVTTVGADIYPNDQKLMHAAGFLLDACEGEVARLESAGVLNGDERVRFGAICHSVSGLIQLLRHTRTLESARTTRTSTTISTGAP